MPGDWIRNLGQVCGQTCRSGGCRNGTDYGSCHSLTRGRLFRVALILSADAGGARLVDIAAGLEGEALVVARVVGEPLAA